MREVCIVPCGKSKIWDRNPQAGPSTAKDVYIGSYAQKCQEYAEAFHPEDWYILSAKHGFLAPDDIVPEPYNVTFNDKRTNPINANELMRQAEKRGLLSCDKVVVLGGKRYRNMVEQVFAGKEIVAPLAGCSGIGVIMQRLNYLIAEKKQPRPKSKLLRTISGVVEKGVGEDIARFYELMTELEDGLGGKRRFQDCTGKQVWPKRGVYFIFEDGENRLGTPNEMRITRVGTHAIRDGEESTLWGRLRNHRGTHTGGGNHRGSVFRRHVGMAILNRSNGAISSPSWTASDPTKEERQKEKELERLVSEYIGRNWLLWLAIDDAPSPSSSRAYIERNSIALLSNPLKKDTQSSGWLGNFSSRNEIKGSGLWNVDHVGQQYDSEFLDSFERYVKRNIL